MTKKFFSILLIISILLSMCACTTFNENYDDEIIQTSNAMLEEWGLEEGRTFSVSKDIEEVYHIDINGEELLIKIEDNTKEGYIKTNAKEYNSEVVENSRGKVIDYISTSNILKDKEELIEYINNVPFKIAEYQNKNDTIAEYDLKEDTVFINSKNLELVCEAMIVHELIHALCQRTNGGAQNLRYPYATFNEVLTDIITASMNPEIIPGMQSGYMEYYQWIYLYLACVGIEGIEAYFYGYDKILTQIPEEELDIFVESIEQIDSTENALAIVCNCINDWGLEKVS